MKDLKFHIERLENHEDIPYDLLKLANPSVARINTHLASGICFLGKLNFEIIGVMVMNEIDETSIEITNIAIKESFQRKGYGKKMLIYADKYCSSKLYKFLSIGTGNSSLGQIKLYQKQGFEIQRIEKDYFIDNYKQPIFENGIQCKHLIILVKRL